MEPRASSLKHEGVWGKGLEIGLGLGLGPWLTFHVNSSQPDASFFFPVQHVRIGHVTAGCLRLNSLLSRARPANSLKSRSTRPFCLFLIDFLCALLLSHVEDGSAAAAKRRNLRRVFGPAKLLPDHRLPAKGDACDAHAGLAGPVLRAGPGGCARHGHLMDNGSAGGAGGWGCGRHGVAGDLDERLSTARRSCCCKLQLKLCTWFISSTMLYFFVASNGYRALCTCRVLLLLVLGWLCFVLTSLYAFLFSGNLLRKARDGTCTTMYGGHDKKTFRQGLLVITGVLATAWHVYL